MCKQRVLYHQIGSAERCVGEQQVGALQKKDKFLGVLVLPLFSLS